MSEIDKRIGREEPEPRFVGVIDRDDYERAEADPEIQQLIQKARKSWQERYGYDPAEGRIKQSGGGTDG